MSLKPSTWRILNEVRSIHARKGLYTDDEVRIFWKNFGPKGFLNIKEISPKIVREIRTKLIEKQ